jgi:hypothetical protein
MADVKISALPAASTPLTGGEVLPVVQSGVTTKVAVSNLTAGLAGTASININGTVGATTPATGAFTTVSATGLITATTAGVTVPTSAAGTVHSGTYTPSLTNGTNMAASTAQPLQYMRVGNTVIVGGYVGIDTTSAGATTTGMRMSLPVASNFTTSTDAGGAGTAPVGGGANDGWNFYANSATDDIQIDGNSMDTAARNLFFTFVYQVK